MTKQRKIFWTGVTMALLAGYFVTFFWMKHSKAVAEEQALLAQVEAAATTAQGTPAGPVVTNDQGRDIRYAFFAGGCFWCVEKDFEKLDGVGDVVSGYTGGDIENPTYEQISKVDTGHREAVQIPYDPTVVTYRELVDYFFRHIDPLDAGGQFCDRGPSYMTAIWVQNDEEREIAESAKAAAEAELGKTVVTPILDAKTFWRAEERHQDFYKTNSTRYTFYRRGCGRDARVAKIWGK
jgi:peptide-methionine (S)-S-oxide reductase